MVNHAVPLGVMPGGVRMGLRKTERDVLIQRVICVARSDQEMSVSRLAERFRVSASAVKRILKSADLDRVWPKGGGIYYETGF